MPAMESRMTTRALGCRSRARRERSPCFPARGACDVERTSNERRIYRHDDWLRTAFAAAAWITFECWTHAVRRSDAAVVCGASRSRFGDGSPDGPCYVAKGRGTPQATAASHPMPEPLRPVQATVLGTSATQGATVTQTVGVDRFLRDFELPGKSLYREYSPSPDLRHVVACLWISVVHRGAAGVRTPIIPDGCSDIMTYGAGAPHVAGTDTRTRWSVLPDGLVITGLRLRPGAVRAVFGCSATSLLDSQAMLGDLGPGPAGFRDQLDRASTLRDRHLALEHWVRCSMKDVSAKDRSVLWACRVLSADPHVQISTISRTLDWHARTIHRQFTDACGYGPKYLQRIMRVQAALRIAHDSPSVISLTGIANTVGYADQAHMNREFRALTGFTPANYFALSMPNVGTWLAEDWRD